MTKNHVRFDDLRDLLHELGFCEAHEETRIRFVNPSTGNVLLFRPHEGKDIVSDRDMLVVRRQLVDNGLIEASEFERFLLKASA